MGHTPAPWHVAPEGKAQSPWIVCDTEGGSIADCEPPGPWMSNETADANAKLIAAAPELLEALKALLPEGWGADDTMDHMPGVKLARAAIAKAEAA